MLVLVLSGYMPLRSESFMRDFRISYSYDFTLDEWFACCEEPEDINEILSVLLGKVTAGGWLGCGDITPKIAANFENLPKLVAGITHEAGGDFAKYLSEYQKET
jgi:hypothetical protein